MESSALSHRRVAAIFQWSAIPFLAMMVAMSLVGAPLKSPAAPRGIITFELCAITADCAAILQTWTARQREYAMLGLGLDYLYLVLYPAVIASALVLLSRSLSPRLQLAARTLAALVVLAGAADAVENYCLIRMLTTGQVGVAAMTAAVCAAAKFAILAVALLALLALATNGMLRRVGVG